MVWSAHFDPQSAVSGPWMDPRMAPNGYFLHLCRFQTAAPVQAAASLQRGQAASSVGAHCPPHDPPQLRFMLFHGARLIAMERIEHQAPVGALYLFAMRDNNGSDGMPQMCLFTLRYKDHCWGHGEHSGRKGGY